MRHKPLIAAAFAAVIVLVAAGCGTGGLGNHKADRARGKDVFTAKCAACHVLADAGAVGTAGPNLDDAFAGSRKQGFKESTFFEVIDKQIKYPTGRDLFDPKREVHLNGPVPTVEMPANIVTGSDRDAVSAYVAAVAGKPVVGGGGGGKVATTDGKQLFTQAGCVACHTLKAAGSSGQIGPNLDTAKPDRARVILRVTNGRGVMPSFKGKLSADQIGAVADYVSSAAGK